MKTLIIHIKKKPDGSAALSCRRADGTVTWQRQEGQQGAFFPLHDLTHYAVETVLGHSRAFYGLVAEGWDLTDFGIPWPRGPLPAEALAAELMVGFLDVERAGGTMWSAAEFNASAVSYHKLSGACVITDRELELIRRERAALFAQWAALPSGETLELRLPRTPPVA